jgi:hypothetical protein
LLVFHILLFLFRLPVFLIAVSAYCLILQWLPLGSVGKKLCLWILMGILGIWWVDLQIDGVRRGSLGQQPSRRLPHAGSVIATFVTSPMDAVYLVAAFDPIFTMSHPGTWNVRRLTLLQAILRAFLPIENSPPRRAALTDLKTLLEQHPDRAIAVLEYTATNSEGIISCLSNLLTVPATAKVFPVSIRYTPSDVTTPDPGAYLAFLWSLLSRPIHCIRVHIADDMNNNIALSPSDKTNNESACLGARHNGDGNPRRRSGSTRARSSARRTSRRAFSVLGVVIEE